MESATPLYTGFFKDKVFIEEVGMSKQPNILGKAGIRWVSVLVALIPLVLIAIFLIYFYK